MEHRQAKGSSQMSGKTQNFIPMLRRLDRGRAMLDLQKGISDIVAAIEQNRGAGAGEVTLKIKIKCEAEGSYTLEPTVTAKVPQPKRLKTTTFLDEESGDLLDRDPRQPDLPSVVQADFRNGVPSGADD
jgi:hypothetical protein